LLERLNDDPALP